MQVEKNTICIMCQKIIRLNVQGLAKIGTLWYIWKQYFVKYDIGKSIFCMAVGYGVDLHKIFAFIVEKQLCNLRLLSSKCSDCGFNLNLSDPCIGIPRDAFECSNLNDLDLPLESNQPHHQSNK